MPRNALIIKVVSCIAVVLPLHLLIRPEAGTIKNIVYAIFTGSILGIGFHFIDRKHDVAIARDIDRIDKAESAIKRSRK